MKFGYVRPRTQSELVDAERRLVADKVFFDIINAHGKGYSDGLAKMLEQVQSGDVVVILSLINAFEDTAIFYNTLQSITSKGATLATLEDDFHSDVPNNSVKFNKVIKTVAEFQIKKEEEYNIARLGAKRMEYPPNFLDVFTKYANNEIGSRAASLQCFMSKDTFLKLAKSWNQ